MEVEVSVVIIGAGMAGLLLCQALRRHGIDAEIYEREPKKDARFQGYRLGLFEIGQGAIRETVSEEQWNTFSRLMEQREGTGGLVIINPANCEVYWDWTQFKSEPKPRLIPRPTLRNFLLDSVGESHVHYSKNFKSFETTYYGTKRKAKVWFEDGTEVTCDLVVGADGSSSRVKGTLGLNNKLDTKMSCLLMYSKLSAELVKMMPSHFVTRYWMVLMENLGIFVSPWLPEQKDGSTNVTQTVNLEAIEWEQSNLVMGIFGKQDEFARDLEGTRSKNPSPLELKQYFLRTLENNQTDERLRILARSASERSAQLVNFYSCTRPSKAWFEAIKDVPAVLIGDALHSMPPTRGMGGNLALADAADLAKRIIRWKESNAIDDLTSGLKGFQEEICHRGFRLVGSSIFWARQYVTGGQIFSVYNAQEINSREEMEADLRFGFPDNASREAVEGIFTPPPI